ncbi:MAG: NYN domain-containing protein [Oscillospiraceae bacterium]|nr:NYN domain-containing protein [Oscillospiraceae bacterium]
MDLNNLRLAVLIDAENVPRKCIKSVMEEIAIYGTPTIKRIYGDWTNPSVAGWKTTLLENAITPIQQYSYTYGKNSSDSAMIIDAMDILYTEKTDGFVIVSSDSDFTRLAIRLREAGQRVLGIGERKTPGAFIAACDKFTYIEVIRANAVEPAKNDDAVASGDDASASCAAVPEAPPETASPPAAAGEDASAQTGDAPAQKPASGDRSRSGRNGRAPTVPKSVVKMIADSISDIAGDDGCVFMGELGNLILKKQPDFDCRNFGHKNLSALIKSIGRFGVDFRQTSDPNIKHPYVHDREA